MTHAKPLPALNVDATTMAEARANCATRALARGEAELAHQFEIGTQDAAWAIRHEVNRIKAERAGKGEA